MANKDALLTKAVKATRNLIERLRSEQASAPATGGRPFGDIVFIDNKLGGISISEPIATLYRACRDDLVRIHGLLPEKRELSRDAVERLLRKTILRSLRPLVPVSAVSRKQFAARLTRELRQMRLALVASKTTWRVILQVRGLAPTGLPFTFGGVAFRPGEKSTGQRVAKWVPNVDASRTVPKARALAENAGRDKIRKEIVDAFSEFAVAEVDIPAVDKEAARYLGVERVRRTVDILNFLSPLLTNPWPPTKNRAYVAPEGARTFLVWAVHPAAGGEFQWSNVIAGSNPLVPGFNPRGAAARKLGVAKVDKLLATDPRSEFEERIVNALAWGGRANVEPRRDMTFLLHAIALEALLTKPTSRSGVTDRLRLRAAHLIGRDAAAKRRVFDRVGQLYDVRSALVHNGDSGVLTDGDLSEMKAVLYAAIRRILTDKRFKNMRTAKEFDDWCDGRILA